MKRNNTHEAIKGRVTLLISSIFKKAETLTDLITGTLLPRCASYLIFMI